MSIEKTVIHITAPAPFMALNRFCFLTGMSVSRVKRMVSEGEMPIIPRQSERQTVLIDLVEVYKLVDSGQFKLETHTLESE
ncbi:hypothetical protein [Psychromonas sp. Urea-02u-13]|uniref:hypothetical protein n=1 Tax=Psychromonas sp. Urea-02u-13 TaxID=2058326 RepID=UPI000C34526F|nr:hypothetical protein [Psychromonas sp. Urea-02u-13]PKG39714.1 hypothetical protein CXF74_07110 [Psychromonas sp. Urea-02u-13]